MPVCIFYDDLLLSVTRVYGSSHLKCRVVVLSVSCKEEVFATNGHASETISSAVLQHAYRERERKKEKRFFYLFIYLHSLVKIQPNEPKHTLIIHILSRVLFLFCFVLVGSLCWLFETVQWLSTGHTHTHTGLAS